MTGGGGADGATVIFSRRNIMIVGLIGPVPQDIVAVSEMLVSDKEIQVVDAISVLRMADRKIINSLPVKHYHKQYFLKKLESELGTVIVTGNLVLSEDMLPWVLDNGGVIVVVSRDKFESYPKDVLETTEKYWDDKLIQKYNLETRFKKFHERLQAKNEGVGNLFLIDVSDENSEQLNELLEVSQEWSESVKSGLKNEEILEMTEVRKDDTMATTVTMEESIKNAMRELGMPVDDDEPTKEEQPKQPEKKKQPPKQPKSAKKAEEKLAEDFINPPEEAAETDETGQQEDNESDEEADAIFVKISDGHMAVLLPAGLQMEKQNIGGMEFNVATVELPDLKSTKLQELTIVSQKSEQPTKQVKPVKRTPIIVAPEKPVKNEQPQKPIKTVVVSGEKSDLVAEKSRLDAEIKKYRQLGDVDTVNELRKQRRAVRNKINKLG